MLPNCDGLDLNASDDTSEVIVYRTLLYEIFTLHPLPGGLGLDLHTAQASSETFDLVDEYWSGYRHVLGV